jgi:CheY-like chemotaxis protein
MAIAGQLSMVLLIDNDRGFQNVLTRVLSLEGYDLQCAANGAEGLKWLSRCTELPELVLLDLVLPVLDGWQFLAQKARNPRLADIPVVIISASEEIGKKAKAAGATAVMGKPFTIEALLNVIEGFAPIVKQG